MMEKGLGVAQLQHVVILFHTEENKLKWSVTITHYSCWKYHGCNCHLYKTGTDFECVL